MRKERLSHTRYLRPKLSKPGLQRRLLNQAPYADLARNLRADIIVQSSQNEQDPGVLIPGSVGLKERLLTKRDVGKLVSFKCTPRREEGLEGPSRTAMSPDRIAAAPPECKNLRIVGSPVEHGVLRAEKDYGGGYEGASIYRWYVVSGWGSLRWSYSIDLETCRYVSVDIEVWDSPFRGTVERHPSSNGYW